MKTFKTAKTILLGLVATAGIGLIGNASVSAWGPERTTFTNDKPATYPVFNSIKDNPTIGDERDFVRVGEVNTDVTNLKNEVNVVPGKKYLVYIYFHNNASATYNDEAHNYSGVATGVRLSTAFPHELSSGQKGKISGTITANNTNPASVWDEAYMTTSSKKVYLEYVAGSAKIWSDWKANGTVMPSSLFTEEGALLGMNSLNGLVPGCNEYHGVVSYEVEAKERSGKIDKTVSKDGKSFKENVEIKAGEEVTFKLEIKNTGTMNLENVYIKDTLPAGLTLVAGSVEKWANESTKKEAGSDAIVGAGINVGTIAKGNTLYYTYRAKASIDFKCKGTNMVNTVKMTYDNGTAAGESVTDTAKVTVTKEKCEDEKKKPGFEMAKRISTDGKDWKESLDAKPGDTAKFNIYFKNTGNVVEKNVVIKDVMNPGAGLEYVPGTIVATRSVSGSSETGGAITTIEVGDELFGNGAVIGDVRAGEIISITYDVKFVADKFDCGTTTLYNNASVSGNAGDSTEVTTVNDSVEIKVTRTEDCDEEPPHTDCTDHPDAPECNELPKTGPVEIAMAIAITLGIAGGGYYFYRTKKSLKTIEGTAIGATSAKSTGKDTTSTDKPAEPKADKK